jgi:hypothetical protein
MAWGWNDTIEAECKRLWIAGKSGTETASALNTKYGTKFSRSAILGKVVREGWNRERPWDVNEQNKAKVHQRGAERAARLGIPYVPPKRLRGPKPERKSVVTSAAPLPGRKNPGACAKSDKWKPGLVWGVIGKPGAEPAAPPVLVDLSSAKILADLDPKDCRFPVAGEGADTLFCAAPKAEASCYCLAHVRRALTADGFALYRKNRARPKAESGRVAQPLQAWAV